MGWGSAGQIFDLVAHALIDAGADDATLDTVCFTLAKSMTDQDWDTVDESVWEFRQHPVVVHALRRAAGWAYLGPEDEAILDYAQRGDEWVLYVRGQERGRRPGTAAGHDELVELWFADGPDDEDRRDSRDRMKIG